MEVVWVNFAKWTVNIWARMGGYMTGENCLTKSINPRLRTLTLYPPASHKQAEKPSSTPLELGWPKTPTHGKTQKNFLANTIDEEMEAQTTDKWRLEQQMTAQGGQRTAHGGGIKDWAQSGSWASWARLVLSTKVWCPSTRPHEASSQHTQNTATGAASPSPASFQGNLKTTFALPQSLHPLLRVRHHVCRS